MREPEAVQAQRPCASSNVGSSQQDGAAGIGGPSRTTAARQPCGGESSRAQHNDVFGCPRIRAG